jgi:hypothetical protein
MAAIAWRPASSRTLSPRYEKLNGQDPKALIVSLNFNRRFPSVSLRAMGLAMMYLCSFSDFWTRC